MTRKMLRLPLMVAPAALLMAVTVGPVGAMPAPGASAEAGTAPVPAAAPRCLTDDVTGTVLGLRDATLRLTNTSGRTCTLQGWPDIALVDAPGNLVPVATRKAGRAQDGARLVLEPQASAGARVQWDDCDADDEACATGVALQYIVDPESTGAAADMAAAPESGLTMRALRVGPLRRL